MLTRLWNDEAGFIVSAELVLVATILVIGMITGLTSVRDAVITELADVGGDIAAVNQSYTFGAASSHSATTACSSFVDTLYFCDTSATSVNTGNSRCLVVNTGPTAETAAGS